MIPANIVVHSKGSNNLVNIHPLDSNVELMTYPLYYPNKSKSWNFKLRDTSGKAITLCDYVKYRLFIRNEDDCDKFIPHHFGKKLFQQWCVDQVTRVEWDRLNYLRLHQKIIQKCKYNALEEYLKEKSLKLGVDIGRQVILPSNFLGSPRNLHENFMDAMTIVKKTGKPVLFITMTCNPNDKDIIKCLNENEYPCFCPEIVARVFKLKADKLIELIVKDEIFGQVIAYCWVIEFQKRGLPHIHLLVTLDFKYKLRTKDCIDRCIKAEIPNKNDDEELYNLVTKFMIHGPCDKNSACWNSTKNKCSKNFPHKFRNETEFNENGFPFYKRPNNGRHVYKKGVCLTNEYVVPYNPFLLKFFQAHINVEMVADIRAVKYLYKYIYKGYDAATIICKNSDNDSLLNYDEISDYLDARCIGPVEACWRLLKFPLQGKSHSVERLDVHLENEQIINVDKECDADNIQDKMQKDSKLIAYFKFMKSNPNCRILYPDMPEYCTWNDKTAKWSFRKTTKKSFGRIYPVSPKQTELYHLRFLLLHVPGSSHEDLKIYDGVKYETFGQACLARGLIRNDNEWKQCLEEASHFKFPKALRSLFANILIHCNPKYPENLWNTFKDDLSYDIKKLYGDCNTAYSQTLYLINQKLLEQDKSLNDFGTMPHLTGKEKRIKEDNVYDPKEELLKANKMMLSMNNEQQLIVDQFEHFLQDNKQELIFIDGPGGTGKTYVFNTIIHLCLAHKKRVCNMAFSGIAATILKAGRTIHNRFKLPLDLNIDSRSGIEKNTKDAQELVNTDLFVWDEAPMCPKYCLSVIDLKLKELMNSALPFGGKSFILGGDFRQILPIKKMPYVQKLLI